MRLFDMDGAIKDENNERELGLNYLFQQIEQDLSNLPLQPNSGEDATVGAFTFIEKLTESLQAEFDESIGQNDSNKKQFIRSLTKVFAILLNIRVDNVEKIKKIIKLPISTVFKLWPGRN